MRHLKDPVYLHSCLPVEVQQPVSIIRLQRILTTNECCGGQSDRWVIEIRLLIRTATLITTLN